MKKTLAAIIAAAMILLCGCSGGSDSIPAPVSVPNGGWTSETLINTVYVEGNKLSCPPKFGDFKKNVKFSKDSSAGNNDTLAVPVYSRNESVVCTLIFNGISDFDDLTDNSPISEILFTDTVGIGDEQISLNGVVMGDSRARVEELLGTPDMQPTDSTFTYTLDGNKGELTVIFNREKIYNVFLTCPDR